MAVNHANTALLSHMAAALGDLRERMVFVGGCATALLITDSAAAPVRATKDVDAIVATASTAEYLRLGQELRSKGFTQTLAEGDPPYRWSFRGMKLDLIPAQESTLGFSDRWYEAALRTAMEIPLGDDMSIRLVTAVYFLATKLDAFEDRGNGDYLHSHDFEDVVAVVDGRAEIVTEVAQADVEVRHLHRRAVQAAPRRRRLSECVARPRPRRQPRYARGSHTGPTEVHCRRWRRFMSNPGLVPTQ